MKEVLAYIEEKKQEFAKLPFFEYMRDTSVDPRQRLAWAPCLTPFVMNFKDLNKLALRKEPTTNKIQKMINHHTYEDGNHWKWFLQDLKLLGFDESQNFTDTLIFLWGEETENVRLMAHNLFRMCSFEEDLLMKLIVIESIEVTANVGLYETGLVAEELRKITNQHYPYFSESHHRLEAGHIHFDSDNIENFFDEIHLTEEETRKAFVLVERVFTDFENATNAMLSFAKKYDIDNKSSQTNIVEKAVSKV
ncbi:MAG: hypothetical protein AAGM40_02250 [Cyanobacteria bacterium J06573_2]